MQEQEQNTSFNEDSEEISRDAEEKPQEQKIALQRCKSVVIDGIFSNREVSSHDTNEFHNQSGRNGRSGDDKNEALPLYFPK